MKWVEVGKLDYHFFPDFGIRMESSFDATANKFASQVLTATLDKPLA